MLPRPMKRQPPRSNVAERISQNLNGITFELDKMKKTLSESAKLFTASDQLLLERGIEKLEAEAEKLLSLLRASGEDADDPFRVA